MTTDKLIDLVMHMANDSIDRANSMMYLFPQQTEEHKFYLGYKRAFNEIYTMLKNIKDGQDNNSETK